MRAAWLMLLFSACQPMEPGNPLEPVTIEPCECECEVCPEVVATDEQAEGTDEKPADTDAADAPVESVGTDGDPFAQAILAKEATEDGADEAPVDEPEVAVMPDAVAWQATQTQPGWGVQLVSVVPGGSPAQAILRLPDGTNQVVRAGDLLPTVK